MAMEESLKGKKEPERNKYTFYRKHAASPRAGIQSTSPSPSSALKPACLKALEVGEGACYHGLSSIPETYMVVKGEKQLP